VMWARDAATSFLRPPADMRRAIEGAGFKARAWEDVTTELAASAAAEVPAHSIQRIIMGDALEPILRAGQQNREEQRIVNVQAVFERG